MIIVLESHADTESKAIYTYIDLSAIPLCGTPLWYSYVGSYAVPLYGLVC